MSDYYIVYHGQALVENYCSNKILGKLMCGQYDEPYHHRDPEKVYRYKKHIIQALRNVANELECHAEIRSATEQDEFNE